MKTAVLVIDMIRDFTDLERGRVANPISAALAPVIQTFIDEVRRRDVLVIWFFDQHRSGKPDWELEHVRPHGEEGSVGVELDPRLHPLPQDYQVVKRRYSAFIGTDLDLILRDNHIERVILTGTKTNVCIRATATDAFERNYYVVVPRECVATDKAHLHEANLEDIGKYMGRVLPAADVLALLDGEREMRDVHA
ncbi:MAG: cysteine hydrolase [Anaerolineae bacterium]|nr:cysteine hydrolase [Anaerolineae bacterium]